MRTETMEDLLGSLNFSSYDDAEDYSEENNDY
jgi:hypothetical protein